MSSISDLVFTVVVIALASFVVLTFILVIRRFIITSFSPKETATLSLVSFMVGMMMMAYLVADTDAEAVTALVILIAAAWLIYRAIKRGWVYYKTKEEMAK
jgi:hypothetical protein